jgi:hypothetical protein
MMFSFDAVGVFQEVGAVGQSRFNPFVWRYE